MAWFFRVVQLENGDWQCRHGLHVFDAHSALLDAVEHCKALASEFRPSIVLAHPRGASIQTVATFD
jgi:hypothetical protein